MTTRKLMILAALLLSHTALKAETATEPAEPALGTTIFGDHEQALGLYLMPWQEELASDIDRPPQLLPLMPELGAAEDAESRAALYESINAYRHAQVGRR